MSEKEEEEKDSENTDQKLSEESKEDEKDEKESKITTDEPNEDQNENEKEKLTGDKSSNIRFKPKVKLDMEKQRYPYCIVWTPIPVITWVLPCIGHVGICSSNGVIHDFAGPYCVSVDNMAFGNPTKYILLELNAKEYDEYDSCIEGGTQDYNEQFYSFCFNNCHSFVARCLNKLRYKGSTNYTMIHVWWMLCLRSKFLNCSKFLETYLAFFIFVILILGFYFLFNH